MPFPPPGCWNCSTIYAANKNTNATNILPDIFNNFNVCCFISRFIVYLVAGRGLVIYHRGLCPGFLKSSPCLNFQEKQPAYLQFIPSGPFSLHYRVQGTGIRYFYYSFLVHGKNDYAGRYHMGQQAELWPRPAPFPL